MRRGLLEVPGVLLGVPVDATACEGAPVTSGKAALGVARSLWNTWRVRSRRRQSPAGAHDTAYTFPGVDVEVRIERVNPTFADAVTAAVAGALRDDGGTVTVHREGCAEERLRADCPCGPQRFEVRPITKGETPRCSDSTS